jgi:uncharacterized repeat protein (TIGR01451 family)
MGLLGATSRLGDADRLSGPRNPATSFFSGQIADDRGELDTAGTFGLRNHTPGAPVGTVAAGGRMTVTFRVRVGSAPSGTTPVQRINRATWTFDYVSCAGQPPQSGAGGSSAAITTVPVADLAVTTTINPATAGSVVSYQIVVSNAGPSAATGAVVTDSGTTPALTNVTWTCSTPPGGGCSPASGAEVVRASAANASAH